MGAEFIGWLAASLTLLAFSQRSMLPLRIAAIGSNLSFISYGIMAHLYPVMVLHVLLLPCNAFRLIQLLSLATAKDTTRDPSGNGEDTGENWERRRAEFQRQICQPLTAAMLYSQMLAAKNRQRAGKGCRAGAHGLHRDDRGNHGLAALGARSPEVRTDVATGGPAEDEGKNIFAWARISPTDPYQHPSGCSVTPRCSRCHRRSASAIPRVASGDRDLLVGAISRLSKGAFARGNGTCDQIAHVRDLPRPPRAVRVPRC